MNDFDEWIRIGIKNGWCGPAVCLTHDGTPMTEKEEAEMYEEDPCIHAIRLYEDVDTKIAVEANHAPSVWRATNQGIEL